MKKLMAIAAAAALIAMAGTAMARGTADLSVTATVAESCTIAAPNTLAFGALDPYLHPAVSTTADVVITCTSGIAYTINDTDGSAQKYLTDGGSGSIPYSVAYATSGSGTGNVTVTGTIAANAYGASTPTGAYGDTIHLEVSP